jgi:protein-disulfide isomerase
MTEVKKIFISLLLFSGISISVQSETLPEEYKQLIEQKVEQRLQEFINSDEFHQQVEKSIIRFIEDENRKRRNQETAGIENLRPVDFNRDHVLGDINAAFTLIVYSDFECPYCKRFHITAHQFIEQHPEVNWVYRHYPLAFHNPGAQVQAEASECAADLGGNKSFWQYTDLIYQRTRSNGKGFPLDDLVPLAEEIGLNGTAFSSCLNSEKYRNKVLNDFRTGQQAGIDGTPGSFLVHHESGMVVPVKGSQPLDKLSSALENLEKIVNADQSN